MSSNSHSYSTQPSDDLETTKQPAQDKTPLSSDAVYQSQGDDSKFPGDYPPPPNSTWETPYHPTPDSTPGSELFNQFNFQLAGILTSDPNAQLSRTHAFDSDLRNSTHDIWTFSNLNSVLEQPVNHTLTTSTSSQPPPPPEQQHQHQQPQSPQSSTLGLDPSMFSSAPQGPALSIHSGTHSHNAGNLSQAAGGAGSLDTTSGAVNQQILPYLTSPTPSQYTSAPGSSASIHSSRSRAGTTSAAEQGMVVTPSGLNRSLLPTTMTTPSIGLRSDQPLSSRAYRTDPSILSTPSYHHSFDILPALETPGQGQNTTNAGMNGYTVDRLPAPIGNSLAFPWAIHNHHPSSISPSQSIATSQQLSSISIPTQTSPTAMTKRSVMSQGHGAAGGGRVVPTTATESNGGDSGSGGVGGTRSTTVPSTSGDAHSPPPPPPPPRQLHPSMMMTSGGYISTTFDDFTSSLPQLTSHEFSHSSLSSHDPSSSHAGGFPTSPSPGQGQYQYPPHFFAQTPITHQQQQHNGSIPTPLSTYTHDTTASGAQSQPQQQQQQLQQDNTILSTLQSSQYLASAYPAPNTALATPSMLHNHLPFVSTPSGTTTTSSSAMLSLHMGADLATSITPSPAQSRLYGIQSTPSSSDVVATGGSVQSGVPGLSPQFSISSSQQRLLASQSQQQQQQQQQVSPSQLSHHLFSGYQASETQQQPGQPLSGGVYPITISPATSAQLSILTASGPLVPSLLSGESTMSAAVLQQTLNMVDLISSHSLPPMAITQQGARFLQSELESGTLPPVVLQAIFQQLLPYMFRLSVHPLANYVAQKLIDNLPSFENAPGLSPLLPPPILYTPADQWSSELKEAYEADQRRMISSPVGQTDQLLSNAFVAWSGLNTGIRPPPLPSPPEVSPPYYCLLVLRAFNFGSGLQSLCTDAFGCRVVQRLLDIYATKSISPIYIEAHQILLDHLAPRFISFSLHQHANHVIQKSVETIPNFLSHPVFDRFFDTKAVGSDVQPTQSSSGTSQHEGYHYNNFTSLATHSFGCRVIQRMFTFCNLKQRQSIVGHVKISFDPLVRDLFGNYVVQWVISTGTKTEMRSLISHIVGKVAEYSMHKCASNVVEKAFKFSESYLRDILIDELLRPYPEPIRVDDISNNPSLANPPPLPILSAGSHAHTTSPSQATHRTHNNAQASTTEAVNGLAGDVKQDHTELTEDSDTLAEQSPPVLSQSFSEDSADIPFDVPLSAIAATLPPLTKYRVDNKPPLRDGEVENPLQAMVTHPYANYVVQALLSVVTPTQKTILSHSIRRASSVLRKTDFSKRVLSKIDAKANAAATATASATTAAATTATSATPQGGNPPPATHHHAGSNMNHHTSRNHSRSFDRSGRHDDSQTRDRHHHHNHPSQHRGSAPYHLGSGQQQQQQPAAPLSGYAEQFQNRTAGGGPARFAASNQFNTAPGGFSYHRHHHNYGSNNHHNQSSGEYQHHHHHHNHNHNQKHGSSGGQHQQFQPPQQQQQQQQQHQQQQQQQ